MTTETITPNKTNLRAWVAALRSGEYKQGKNRLLDLTNNTYCCLGVASALAAEAGVVECLTSEDGDVARFGAIPDGGHLCPEVREWLGTGDALDPVILDTHPLNHGCASWLNDIGQYTFAEIADAIEHTYELNEPAHV